MTIEKELRIKAEQDGTIEQLEQSIIELNNIMVRKDSNKYTYDSALVLVYNDKVRKLYD